MDESDFFIREFVKSRNKSFLKKVKLKKVVSDIILAQKVRRFLLSAQTESKQTTSNAPLLKRRLSVRVLSPHGYNKQNQDNRRNPVFKNVPPAQDNALPRITDISRKSSKVSLASILLSASKDGRTKSEDNPVYPRILDKENYIPKSKGVPQNTQSGKMPRIGNRSASGTMGRTAHEFSVPKPPRLRVFSDGDKPPSPVKSPFKNRTSLPALSDSVWAGDPKAIGSVRRPRKNAREMLASYKSGEETRRLFREMTVTCTKNNHKPDFFTEIERMYTELPSLLPAVEKAREDMASVNERYSDMLKERQRRSSISLMSIHSQAPSRRNSLAVSHTTERKPSTPYQQTTLRPHGAIPSKVASGIGYRH